MRTVINIEKGDKLSTGGGLRLKYANVTLTIVWDIFSSTFQPHHSDFELFDIIKNLLRMPAGEKHQKSDLFGFTFFNKLISAKISSVHCSTSVLALGSPGCSSFVVTMPEILYKPLQCYIFEKPRVQGHQK